MTREAERKRLVELLWERLCGGDVQWAGEVADHLLDNGIVVPPVKANTFAYFFDRNEIKEGYVERIISNKRGTRITVCYDGIQFKIFKPCDFGKTVFLTREEAEKALRKEDEKQ